MLTNRSIPSSSVIPVLVYPDVPAAVAWICANFGFRERLRIGDGHRSQLRYGDGALIVADVGPDRAAPGPDDRSHSIIVRVEDARAHCEHARAGGARIVTEPTDLAFGERQYSVLDPWDHQWTFSQSIADLDPADWGGTPVDLS